MVLVIDLPDAFDADDETVHIHLLAVDRRPRVRLTGFLLAAFAMMDMPAILVHPAIIAVINDRDKALRQFDHLHRYTRSLSDFAGIVVTGTCDCAASNTKAAFRVGCLFSSLAMT